jgi:hypothetical protein
MVNILSRRDSNISCPSDSEIWAKINQESMVHFPLMQQRNYETMINGLMIKQDEIIH